MSGVTLTSRETELLADIVQACATEVSETPLPVPVIEMIGQLVPSDEISFNGLDSSAPGAYLVQEYDGAACWTEVPDEPVAEEAEEPFWQHYWAQCAGPEITRDFVSITKISDFVSQRQWWASPMRVEYLTEVRWEMMLAIDDGGSRTVRLLFFRTSGRDYDERERFLLSLLRPHIEQSYRTWQQAHAARAGGVPLTPRQRELVLLVGAGLTNRQIARQTGLSEGTVRTHLVNIYRRLGVNSRTAAVMRVLGEPGEGSLPGQRVG